MGKRGEFKPYLFPDEPYLKMTYRDSYQDFITTNTEQHNDVYRPSEHHKPYKWPNAPGHPSWEWVWPEIPDVDPTCMQLGNCPCVGDCTPDTCDPRFDPACNPCSIDDHCHFCGIIGPSTVWCGEQYPFLPAYFLEGCNLLLDFQVSWQPERGEMITHGVLATYQAPEECGHGDQWQMCLDCPYNCNSCVTLTCECCCDCPPQGCEIVGSQDADPGTTWTGYLYPCCNGWGSPTVSGRLDSDDPDTSSASISADGCAIIVEISEDA